MVIIASFFLIRIVSGANRSANSESGIQDAARGEERSGKQGGGREGNNADRAAGRAESGVVVVVAQSAQQDAVIREIHGSPEAATAATASESILRNLMLQGANAFAIDRVVVLNEVGAIGIVEFTDDLGVMLSMRGLVVGIGKCDGIRGSPCHSQHIAIRGVGTGGTGTPNPAAHPAIATHKAGIGVGTRTVVVGVGTGRGAHEAEVHRLPGKSAGEVKRPDRVVKHARVGQRAGRQSVFITQFDGRHRGGLLQNLKILLFGRKDIDGVCLRGHTQ